MSKVKWRGVILDSRTRDQMVEVDRLTTPYLRPSQGSYSKGPLSAGTHSGGGAIDLDTSKMSITQILQVVRAMRLVGMSATWYRRTTDGFPVAHIHGISTAAPDQPAAAKAQIASVRAGRNGLRSNKPDPHAGMKVSLWATWEKYLAWKNRKSLTTIAREVIAGKWGSGETRISRLKAAGYDPVAVQRIVNQLI